MLRKKTMKLVITFHTTADAMAMEELCKKRGIGGRLIPVPRSISAGCGLAFCAEESALSELETAMSEIGLDREGVHHCLI